MRTLVRYQIKSDIFVAFISINCLIQSTRQTLQVLQINLKETAKNKRQAPYPARVVSDINRAKNIHIGSR